MSPIKSMIALACVLVSALGSAGALAQNGVAPQPPTGKPVSDSATYGPVLNPQENATTQQKAGEARPQAQEERAGQPPVTSKQNEADPSARPAPEAAQPQAQPRTQQEQQGRQERQKDVKKQAQRRPGAVQRIDSTPRIAAPVAAPMPQTPSRGVAAPVAPQTSQVVGCAGSNCTDASGATYNAGGPGNTTVSSGGRLCTRNGANMQCL